MKTVRPADQMDAEAASYNDKQLLTLYWLSDEADYEWREALENEILDRMHDSLASHKKLEQTLRHLARVLGVIAVIFLLVVVFSVLYLAFRSGGMLPS